MPATAAVSPRTAITRLRQFAQLRAPLCASGRGVFQVHPPRTCCAVALLRLCWRYYACRRCCMTTALHYDPSVPAVSTKECLSCRGRDQLVFRSSLLLPLRLPVVLFACLASGLSALLLSSFLSPSPFLFPSAPSPFFPCLLPFAPAPLSVLLSLPSPSPPSAFSFPGLSSLAWRPLVGGLACLAPSASFRSPVAGCWCWRVLGWAGCFSVSAAVPRCPKLVPSTSLCIEACMSSIDFVWMWFSSPSGGGTARPVSIWTFLPSPSYASDDAAIACYTISWC